MPIGNLTSQIFANIYMNEFDQFMKHDLKVKNYARYTDDFVIVSENINYLKSLLFPIKKFLRQKLKLELHPNKVTIRKFREGIDFLGYNILPNYKILRAKTKKRIIKRIREKVLDYKNGEISEENLTAVTQSYFGVFSHANMYEFIQNFKNKVWFWLKE